MQALILAAGRGSRLGKKSEQTPKCLLQLGHQRLIDHQLEILAEAGVAPVALVVGYCSDDIREEVGIRAEYIDNPKWSTTNSLYSFNLAREWINGPFLVLNSDVITHPDAIEKLLNAPGDAFTYDSESGDAREHMKVDIENGILKDMSKELPIEKSAGENVGILKFTKETGIKLFDTAEKLLKNGHEKSWLGSAVREVAQTANIEAVDVAGVPWGEIDSCHDLDRVRKLVIPQMTPKALKRSRRKKTTVSAITSLTAITLILLSFLALRPSLVYSEQAWENLVVTGADEVDIASDGRLQKWWLLTQTNVAKVRVHGPDTIRLDSRVVLHKQRPQKVPYVIEVRLDGKRLDWFVRTKNPSSRWKLGDENVGRKEGIKIDIPDGAHELSVRLVATDSQRCLVRLRQVSDETEED